MGVTLRAPVITISCCVSQLAVVLSVLMSTTNQFYVPDSKARKRISSALKISYEAVRKWKKIPDGRVLEVCEIEEWRITPHEARPDMYPNPTDGLPAHVAVSRFMDAEAV